MDFATQRSSESTRAYAVYPSIRGRKVLITGGASGIGESIVSHFTGQGAQVAVLDIQDDAADSLRDRLAKSGMTAPRYIHTDLTNVDATVTSVTAAIEAMGGLDILVNNAGNDQRHTVEDVTPDLWDRLMAVNLRHFFFVTQTALPALRKSAGGSVVNMSSIAWLIPSTGLPIYVSAKAAIVGLTRTLAHELGNANIRVNCVLPGSIATERQKRLWLSPEYIREVLDRQALKRQLIPEEVARLVLFLAADDSSAMTGQAYIVDGGWV